MKSHVKHLTVGGIVAPLALLLATVIANEGQTLLGLGLDKGALALYLTPFLLGAAAILHGQLKLEAAKVANELDLGQLLGGIDVGALLGNAPTAPSATATVPPPPGPKLPPPPTPPAP